MPESDDFLYLSPGLILPWAPVLAVLRVEAAGHRLMLDADGVLVERGRGCPPIDPDDLADLRRWREHVRLFVEHCLNDGARDASDRFPRTA